MNLQFLNCEQLNSAWISDHQNSPEYQTKVVLVRNDALYPQNQYSLSHCFYLLFFGSASENSGLVNYEPSHFHVPGSWEVKLRCLFFQWPLFEHLSKSHRSRRFEICLLNWWPWQDSANCHFYYFQVLRVTWIGKLLWSSFRLNTKTFCFFVLNFWILAFWFKFYI